MSALSEPTIPRLVAADLEQTETARAHLQAYRQHIARVFELAGSPSQLAAQQADVVVSVESRLVRAVEKPGKPEFLSIDQLTQTTPGFNWKNYLHGLGRPDIEKLGVGGK